MFQSVAYKKTYEWDRKTGHSVGLMVLICSTEDFKFRLMQKVQLKVFAMQWIIV